MLIIDIIRNGFCVRPIIRKIVLSMIMSMGIIRKLYDLESSWNTWKFHMRELLNYRRHKEKSCQGYVKNVYQDIWRSTTSCNYFLTTITACKLSDFQVSIRGVKLFEISKRFQQLKVIVIFGHAHFRVFRLFVENRKKKRFATIFTKIIPQKHQSV